jgi:hypothetical protein
MPSQHGIPSEIRAEVWKYLLDVSKPDKSEEVSTTKRLAENYWDMTEVAQNDVETLRAVKLQLRSYTPQWDAVLDAKSRKMIERIAVCFLYHNTFAECSPSIAFPLPPVIICTQEESDAFYCFQGLMVRIITHMPEQDMKLRVARFVMLFKTIYPEINAALEEEEVEVSVARCAARAEIRPARAVLSALGPFPQVNEWAVSWLRYLLCRELPAENALRLWDSYFAADQPQVACPDPVTLHRRAGARAQVRSREPFESPSQPPESLSALHLHLTHV